MTKRHSLNYQKEENDESPQIIAEKDDDHNLKNKIEEKE